MNEENTTQTTKEQLDKILNTVTTYEDKAVTERQDYYTNLSNQIDKLASSSSSGDVQTLQSELVTLRQDFVTYQKVQNSLIFCQLLILFFLIGILLARYTFRKF